MPPHDIAMWLIVRCTAMSYADAKGRSRSVREAQVLGSESDSDDSGPVFGGRSDDEGQPPSLCIVSTSAACGYPVLCCA